MKNKTLVKILKCLDPEAEVMILDGSNGGGTPRKINLGPVMTSIEEKDVEESDDCEGMLGKEIISMGYGCY